MRGGAGAVPPTADDQEKTVNPQITDAITQTNVKILGEAPAQAMAVLYQTMSHSISLAMESAQQNQNQMQTIGKAVVAAACERIMKAAGS